MTDASPALTPAVVADLLQEATRRLVRTADGLRDDGYAAPSGLPRWSRAHVLAHLTLNAEGLAGAVRGVLEGRPTTMYASDASRDGDIEALATESPSLIRSRLLGSSSDLADALAAVPGDLAGTSIERTPGGRTFPVGAVPSMRLREVEIHHADLAAGYGRHDWPPAFAALLLDTTHRDAGATPFTVRATDLGREWAYGEGGPVVSGTASDLGWWITGRGTGEGLASEGGTLPQIGAW